MKCPVCNKIKRRTSFYTDKKNKSGLTWACKQCIKDRRKARYCSVRQKVIQIKARYQITTEEVVLLKKIKKCDICGKKISWTPGAKGFANIDHCHDSKQIRGVLCNGCNTGLGKLGDTVETVRRALNYTINPPGIYRERKAAG